MIADHHQLHILAATVIGFDQLARLTEFQSFSARGTLVIDRTFDILPEDIGADGDVLELLGFPLELLWWRCA